ncbi:MAG: peptide deformylase [Cyanobacteria bacterium SID2]|nr:peptide deformylase [Cyanobacteria bacterium SID2]MBP0005230.1 peptide deformylase [Cyanobacteria bacterium SBC]
MPTQAPILVEKTKLEKPPLSLHYLGDRVLRQNAKRISRVDESIRKLAKEMLQSMYSADGIGLAAPQVGVNKQILVVDCNLNDPTTPPLILINPTIHKVSREIAIGEEGCLSIPGVYLDVKRPAAIEVSYKDDRGRPQRRTFDGLPARAIQHEMDHLHGILFVDRVENEFELTEQLAKHGFSVNTVRRAKN